MTSPRVLTIQVGMPASLGSGEQEWQSGIYKSATAGPIWLGQTNLAGDGQADLVHHGGPDKAVLAYAAAHYPVWRRELQMPDLPYGGFGENFTVDGLTEWDVCIGDLYAVGEALVEVSQPRGPCWKLSRRWGIPDLDEQVATTRRTGWYLRVIREGHVAAGDELLLKERPEPEWTAERVSFITTHIQDELGAAAELARSPHLAASRREWLTRKIGEFTGA